MTAEAEEGDTRGHREPYIYDGPRKGVGGLD